jgi:hypothetical protein
MVSSGGTHWGRADGQSQVAGHCLRCLGTTYLFARRVLIDHGFAVISECGPSAKTIAAA